MPGSPGGRGCMPMPRTPTPSGSPTKPSWLPASCVICRKERSWPAGGGAASSAIPARWLVAAAGPASRIPAGPGLGLLAERGGAVSALARLDADSARLALLAVATDYGVLSVASAAETGVPSRAPVAKKRKISRLAGASEMPPQAWTALRVLNERVPEAWAPELGGAQRQLLGLALALVRAPLGRAVRNARSLSRPLLWPGPKVGRQRP